MPDLPYTAPGLNLSAFHCPHCFAYANHIWFEGAMRYAGSSFSLYDGLTISRCAHCNEHMIWLRDRTLYPKPSPVQAPNADLSEPIRTDYEEARAIVNRSPRGAAALLRLCVQKLCGQLGESETNLSVSIGNLVKKGLPALIQQALDIVRVIGNNSVHPGVIDLRDDRETALALFKLLNKIAEVMITEPREIAAMYETLPAAAREQIERRDTT